MPTIIELLLKTTGFWTTWLILIVFSILIIFSIEYCRLVLAPRFLGKSKKQRAIEYAERKANKAREDEIARRAYIAGLEDSMKSKKNTTIE